jgi:glycosyltransferase involved in cell wall biosynthesis
LANQDKELVFLKIAHICGPLVRPAGTERSIVELALEMKRQNIEARIYTPFLRENLFNGMCKQLDIEEVRVPTLPLFGVYYDLYTTKRLVSEASKWADVLILHSCHAIASYALRRFSMPCIPFYHIDKWDWNVYGHLGPLAPIYARPLIALEMRSLQQLPIAFANSRNLASVIQQHAPYARIVPITIGVDTSRFYPVWGRDDGFVMMAGRFHPMNNFEIGIRAMAGTGFEVLVAGLVEPKFRWYYDQLRELVLREKDLKDKVVFKTLSESELIDRLQSCSLFLSPRKYDYLGHAAMEPMACGKPVVQLSSDSHLEDDPPVVLCNSKVSQWTAAVQTLMLDSEERRDLGKRAYEFIQEKHSLKASVSQLLYYANQVSLSGTVLQWK